MVFGREFPDPRKVAKDVPADVVAVIIEKGRAEEFYRRTVATHHEVLETLWRRSEALGTTSSIWVPVVFLSEKSFEACSEWTGASEQYSFYNQGLEAIICRLP